MPGIPKDVDFNSLGVIKSGNLPPLISSAAVNGRDGTRAIGPDAPEFTVSKTDTTITALITDGKGATSYESSIDGAAWVPGLTVNGLTAETTYSLRVRGIDGNGTGAPSVSVNVTTNEVYNPVGILFQDSFDSQPDWDSGLPENDKGGLKLSDNGIPGGWDVDIAQHRGIHLLPVGWDHVRQTPAFAPSRGYPNKNEGIEILAASAAGNSNKVHGGTGKSVVMWRESTDGNWHNDKILVKVLPQAYNQIYIEFYFNYSNEFIANYYDESVRSAQNLSKLFRAFCWDGIGDIFSYHGEDFTGHKVPYFGWGMEGRPTTKGGYGFRNTFDLRNRRDSTGPGNERFIDWDGNPEEEIGSSYHPTTTLKQGGNALTDRLTGQPMTSGMPAINVDQIFGDETNWTKMAFYAQLNSAPGMSDGVLKQWIDDTCIVDITTAQWVVAGKPMPAGWTTFAFGGNDFFKGYPSSEAYKHWFAYDDLVVRDSIPQELL